jgi:hypothetical protein
MILVIEPHLPAVTLDRPLALESHEPRGDPLGQEYQGSVTGPDGGKKDEQIEGFGSTREVCDHDPWTNARAWARTRVHFVARK